MTSPEPSTLSEVCQEVVQPRPKMPGVVAAGNRRHEGPVDGQRQAAGRGQRGIDGGGQRRGRELGVGLGNQERPERADVADLGRGFAEPAEVGRGLGQGGVVGIGRRADRWPADCRRRRSRPRSECSAAGAPPAAMPSRWSGPLRSGSPARGAGRRRLVSSSRSVRVSWPLWPGRRMPAGPLGATARTWAVWRVVVRVVRRAERDAGVGGRDLQQRGDDVVLGLVGVGDDDRCRSARSERTAA